MNISNKKEFSIDFHGRKLKFVVSDMAEQANASVLGTYGNTSVLVTVVMSNEDRDVDFFPLTVDYEERFYAVGKVLGSRFMRREGRPSDFAILSGRLIDRTIRPLFNHKLRRQVQVVITILSYDEQNDPDFIALITTSVALSISDIPWDGAVAGIRILGKKGGDVAINPTNEEAEDFLEEEGSFDAFYAGTENKINMIEIAGHEAKENDVEKSFEIAHNEIKKLVDFQNKIVDKIGKDKKDVALVEINEKLKEEIRAFKSKFEQEMFLSNGSIDKVKGELFERLKSLEIEMENVDLILDELLNEIVHEHAILKNERVDGRKMDDIRSLYAEAGLFERLHGSAFFSRGKTQSLAVTTLAPPSAEQIVETMEITMKRRFIFHYNFPPYSTGEVGRMGSPSRREIGHGSLAAKAIRPMIPSKNKFPYTIRVVSEILSSNGSSSMASVCAGILSLMDAGVPIKKPVAGIAMGLMTWHGVSSKKDGDDEFKILTDIQGPEDHYGDMDFKVAGTRDGITAIQMDVKIEGIDKKIFDKAIEEAKNARFKILDVIEKVLDRPRPHISKYAPAIHKILINPEQIGTVIGSGGKVINGIIEKYGLESIDIDEDGQVYISGKSIDDVKKATKYIESLTKEYEVGDVVTGKVIKLMDFGAIVDLGGGKDGMIHVSEIKNDYVKDIHDVLKGGDIITAKVIKVDNGKIGLSIKALNNNKKDINK